MSNWIATPDYLKSKLETADINGLTLGTAKQRLFLTEENEFQFEDMDLTWQGPWVYVERSGNISIRRDRRIRPAFD